MIDWPSISWSIGSNFLWIINRLSVEPEESNCCSCRVGQSKKGAGAEEQATLPEGDTNGSLILFLVCQLFSFWFFSVFADLENWEFTTEFSNTISKFRSNIIDGHWDKVPVSIQIDDRLRLQVTDLIINIVMFQFTDKASFLRLNNGSCESLWW